MSTKSPDEIKKGLECCGITGNCYACPYYSYCHETLSESNNNHEYMGEIVCRDALTLIQQLESRVLSWISVEERLPEDRAFVLMHIPGCALREGIYLGTTGFEYYDKAEKPWAWKNVDELVTHWMPLPEPPKE